VLKVATPLVVVAVAGEGLNVPPPLSVRVTAVPSATKLPLASVTVAVTGDVKFIPSCCVPMGEMTTEVAAPAVTANGLEVAVVAPELAVSTSAAPTVLTDRFENVAMPLAFVTVLVAPLSAPEPVVRLRVTGTPAPMTTPLLSSTVTATENVPPAATLNGGSVVNDRLPTALEVTVNVLLVLLALAAVAVIV
jgi:hypothetical protein